MWGSLGASTHHLGAPCETLPTFPRSLHLLKRSAAWGTCVEKSVTRSAQCSLPGETSCVLKLTPQTSLCEQWRLKSLRCAAACRQHAALAVHSRLDAQPRKLLWKRRSLTCQLLKRPGAQRAQRVSGGAALCVAAPSSCDALTGAAIRPHAPPPHPRTRST